MHAFTHRAATEADIPQIAALMARAIDRLQDAFLTPAQVAASRAVMGLDTQLIADRTYVVVHDSDGALVGCGGWSRRATLYGGDHSVSLRDAALLDPAIDAARIRADVYRPGPGAAGYWAVDPVAVRGSGARRGVRACRDDGDAGGRTAVPRMRL
jgi:hypothetical protein